MISRTQIFGLQFISASHCSEVVDDILLRNAASAGYMTNNQLPLLITPNVDDVVKFHQSRYQAITDAMKKASYILPDGQFVVWASWLLRKPLKRRLPGSDLFPVFWNRIKGSQSAVLLIAPDEAVGKQLKREHPLLEYYVPPFFDENDAQKVQEVIQTCIALANELNPEFILLGIRFPKQHAIAIALSEMYAQKHAPSKTPLIMLLGASFEFYLGIKKRAPKWVRFLGLEWFHRFVQEPRRLFKRFFIDDLAFFPIVWKEMFKP